MRISITENYTSSSDTTMNEHNSLPYRVPNELYFQILQFLRDEVDSYRASFAILNLALSEKGNFRFISDWCNENAKSDLLLLEYLESIKSIVSLPNYHDRPTALSVFANELLASVEYAITELLLRSEINSWTSVSVMLAQRFSLERFLKGEKTCCLRLGVN